MSEVSGLSGRLKIGVTRCFFDEKVQADHKGEDLVIKIDLKPVESGDAAFCNTKITITVPQRAGAFGYVGQMEWVYGRLNGHIAHARFSFASK
jgi:hypothetical protein